MSIKALQLSARSTGLFRVFVTAGRGFGLLGNTIVGIVGSLVFEILFGNFNLLNSAILNKIAGGTIGAVVLLFLISVVKKAT